MTHDSCTPGVRAHWGSCRGEHAPARERRRNDVNGANRSRRWMGVSLRPENRETLPPSPSQDHNRSPRQTFSITLRATVSAPPGEYRHRSRHRHDAPSCLRGVKRPFLPPSTAAQQDQSRTDDRPESSASRDALISGAHTSEPATNAARERELNRAHRARRPPRQQTPPSRDAKEISILTLASGTHPACQATARRVRNKPFKPSRGLRARSSRASAGAQTLLLGLPLAVIVSALVRYHFWTASGTSPTDATPPPMPQGSRAVVARVAARYSEIPRICFSTADRNE